MQFIKSFLSVSSLFLVLSLQSVQVFADTSTDGVNKKSTPIPNKSNVTAPAAPTSATPVPAEIDKSREKPLQLDNRTLNDPEGNSKIRVRKQNQEYDPANDPIVCNKNSSSPESTTDCNK